MKTEQEELGKLLKEENKANYTIYECAKCGDEYIVHKYYTNTEICDKCETKYNES